MLKTCGLKVLLVVDKHIKKDNSSHIFKNLHFDKACFDLHIAFPLISAWLHLSILFKMPVFVIKNTDRKKYFRPRFHFYTPKNVRKALV